MQLWNKRKAEHKLFRAVNFFQSKNDLDGKFYKKVTFRTEYALN